MSDKALSDLESKLLEKQQEKDKLQGRLSTSESQFKISQAQQLCLKTTINSLQKDRATFLGRKTELEDKVLEEQQAKQNVQSKLKNEVETNAKLMEKLASEKRSFIDLKVEFDKSEEALTNVEFSSDRSSTLDPAIQSWPRSTTEHSNHQTLGEEPSSFTQTRSDTSTDKLFIGSTSGAGTRSSSPSTAEHPNDEISLPEPSNFTQSRADSGTDELIGDELSVSIPQSRRKEKRTHRAGKKVSKRNSKPSKQVVVSGEGSQPVSMSKEGSKPVAVCAEGSKQVAVSEEVLEALPAIVPAAVPPIDSTTVPLRNSSDQGYVPFAQPSTGAEGHNSLSSNQAILGLASNQSLQATPELPPKSTKQVTPLVSSKWSTKPEVELPSMWSTPPTHSISKQKVCWYFSRTGNCRHGDHCRNSHPKPGGSCGMNP